MSELPPGKQPDKRVEPTKTAPGGMVNPVPPAAEPEKYLDYIQEKILISTTAQPVFTSNIYRPRPVHYLNITVQAMGTAAHVYVGDKNTQLVDLTAAGKNWVMTAPHNMRFDANRIYVKADVGTTTYLMVEILE